MFNVRDLTAKIVLIQIPRPQIYPFRFLAELTSFFYFHFYPSSPAPANTAAAADPSNSLTDRASLSTLAHTYARTCTSVTRMGNANGREEGSENGGADEVSEGSNHAPSGRVPSADLMVSSPPRDPHQSRAPLLFSSQVRSLFLFFEVSIFVVFIQV